MSILQRYWESLKTRVWLWEGCQYSRRRRKQRSGFLLCTKISDAIRSSVDVPSAKIPVNGNFAQGLEVDAVAHH